jgi:predicted metalloprotease
MRWDKLRRSQNVEDRRGQGASRAAGLRLPFGGGIGLIILLVLAFLFGGPEMVLNILSGTETSMQTGSGVDAPSRPQAPGTPDPEKDFVDAVLGSTEDVWSALFAEGRARYAAPGMVVFEQETKSACGQGYAATGPFYCPADRKLYIDLSFFRELARMGGPGDFAQAYVIGHEVGHHVQTLLGTAEEVRRLQARAGDERSVNRLQVAMELQADCYAGVWAHHANRMHDHALLEPGDIDEGLAAAAAIGDDRLQRSAGRRVAPDSFTHGSSADRQHWLGVGLRTGDPDACDTFRSR